MSVSLPRKILILLWFFLPTYASAMGLFRSESDDIAELVAPHMTQPFTVMMDADIPLCEQQWFNSRDRDVVLTLSYSLEALAELKSVEKTRAGSIVVSMVLADLQVKAEPQDLAYSFKLQAYTGDSGRSAASALVKDINRSIVEEKILLAQGAALALAKDIKKHIQDNLSIDSDIEINFVNVAPELQYPPGSCSDIALRVRAEVDGEMPLFARGFLPSRRSQATEQDKVFLKNTEGKKLAFAFKNDVAEEHVALLRAREEMQYTEEEKLRGKPVGGEKVPADRDADFLVAVVRKNASGELSQFCAGTLYSPTIVITAAHCSTNNSNYVLVGRRNLTGSEGELIPIRGVWRHIDFKKAAPFDADIAILQLEEEVSAQYRDILPVIDRPVRVGDRVEVSGWGAHRFGGKGNQELYYILIDVMNDYPCSRPYRDTRVPVTDNMFCASAPNKDACSGDSGGGAYLVDRRIEPVALAGIVSYGIGCGDAKFSGVYTEVFRYRDWIRDVSAALAALEVEDD